MPKRIDLKIPVARAAGRIDLAHRPDLARLSVVRPISRAEIAATLAAATLPMDLSQPLEATAQSVAITLRSPGDASVLAFTIGYAETVGYGPDAPLSDGYAMFAAQAPGGSPGSIQFHLDVQAGRTYLFDYVASPNGGTGSFLYHVESPSSTTPLAQGTAQSSSGHVLFACAASATERLRVWFQAATPFAWGFGRATIRIV